MSAMVYDGVEGYLNEGPRARCGFSIPTIGALFVYILYLALAICTYSIIIPHRKCAMILAHLP